MEEVNLLHISLFDFIPFISVQEGIIIFYEMNNQLFLFSSLSMEGLRETVKFSIKTKPTPNPLSPPPGKAPITALNPDL